MRAFISVLVGFLCFSVLPVAAQPAIASPASTVVGESVFIVPAQTASFDHIPVVGMLERASLGARPADYSVRLVCSTGRTFDASVSMPRSGGLPFDAALPLSEVGATCGVVATTTNPGQTFSFYRPDVRPSTGSGSVSSVRLRAMIVNHSGNGGL
ncbi:hypothetical protein C5B96_04050 [Subtercola sp. Z020]|uniref:hypothetical protein n=1 Tax=Subtercola sp. Z020 TaxID=2080582 RepID=UPI000CE7308E|nr:hypothetical protein [Subtercola sp. Z020]PPF87651.1 hypothetical protein C5B96_04050 [Subtercola sp. Z020]